MTMHPYAMSLATRSRSRGVPDSSVQFHRSAVQMLDNVQDRFNPPKKKTHKRKPLGFVIEKFACPVVGVCRFSNDHCQVNFTCARSKVSGRSPNCVEGMRHTEF